ncbi:MAG TPA: hypothetical protein VHY20_16330, partial [Pirellulales bacterium]|nr:hypothetical protein [Pirellulales bacterium]
NVPGDWTGEGVGGSEKGAMVDVGGPDETGGMAPGGGGENHDRGPASAGVSGANVPPSVLGTSWASTVFVCASSATVSSSCARSNHIPRVMAAA